jgi:hypothetical protein
MSEPGVPSGWVVASGPPKSRRRVVALALVAIAIAVALFAGAIVAIAQSSFGHGFGAAIAIYAHGKPQVYRANYSAFTGQEPTMDVYLAVGVDVSEARGIGCGLVRRELEAAGLPDVEWIIHAASGEALTSSTVAGCR